MDPLTALGLASNVIQMISFTNDLISKGREIYKSADGTLVENLELEAIASNLQDLSIRLSFPLDGKKASELSSADKQLRKLCQDCDAVSRQLIEAINGLKVQGSHRRWNSFRQALKSVWKEGKVEELSRRLERYRDEIDTTLLVSIKEQIQRDESISAQDLGRRGQNTDEPREEAKEWQEKIMKELHLNRLELQNQQDMANFSSKLTAYSKDTRDQLVKARILSKLRFDDIADRYERIEEAHRKTFEWIFSTDGNLNENSTKPQSSNFVDWLKNKKENLYWITGKPGSGKSTLMKYLYNDPRTLKHLQVWAGRKPLVRAGFFFWNSGTTMQMSRMGLLQALLYESLEKSLDEIPALFPERWKSYELFGGDLHPWTWSELVFAFKTLIFDKSRKFFFLIDGLDEFDGDCGDLADFALKHSTNPNVKMCVASRPWLVFEDAFQRQPSLRVEDLTANDIHIFVSEKLRANNMFLKREAIQREEARNLMVQVTEKASGVFLWVRLVVVSLLEGLRDGDDITGLLKRLLILPSDLEDLFLKILDNLNPSYFEEASKLFQIVQAADKLSLLDLSFAEGGLDEAIRAKIEPTSFEKAEFRVETMRRRLSSRCKGLLEAPAPKTDRHVAHVQYLHRTVKDFIQRPERWDYIISGTPQSFDPNKSLCGSYLQQLKVASMKPNTLALFNKLVVSCIRYSVKFDEKDPISHIKVLKEMDRVASNLCENLGPNGLNGLITMAKEHSPRFYSSSTFHWSELLTNFTGLLTKSFFDFAFANGLYLYVSSEMDVGQNPNSRIGDIPLLSIAADRRDTKMIRILLNHGADPNLTYGKPPLTPWSLLLRGLNTTRSPGAIGTTESEIILAFLEHNADPNLTPHHLLPDKAIQITSQSSSADGTAKLLDSVSTPRVMPTAQKSPSKTSYRIKNLFQNLRRRDSKPVYSISQPVLIQDSLYAALEGGDDKSYEGSMRKGKGKEFER